MSRLKLILPNPKYEKEISQLIRLNKTAGM